MVCFNCSHATCSTSDNNTQSVRVRIFFIQSCIFISFHSCNKNKLNVSVHSLCFFFVEIIFGIEIFILDFSANLRSKACDIHIFYFGYPAFACGQTVPKFINSDTISRYGSQAGYYYSSFHFSYLLNLNKLF